MPPVRTLRASLNSIVDPNLPPAWTWKLLALSAVRSRWVHSTALLAALLTSWSLPLFAVDRPNAADAPAAGSVTTAPAGPRNGFAARSVSDDRDAPLSIPRLGTDVRLVIDGRLDESVWSEVPLVDRFHVVDPETREPTRYPTRVRAFYTAEGLYIGAELDQPPETRIARLSSRDRRDLNRDSITVMLDTSGEGRYGYYFGLNLGDSVDDGTLLPERQFSADWDGPWRGATAVTKTGWSAELFLPWSMMSMPMRDRDRRIGLYLERRVAHLDERWSWPALLDTEPRFLSAFRPVLLTGVNPRQEYSLFPYVSGSHDRLGAGSKQRVGADVFWRPSSAFQLMATLNPDFGNVETDNVVVNLGAFETFFSEKRLFFLEGHEAFVTSPRTTPTLLNTRRIGGTPRRPANPLGATIPATQLQQPTDLVGALKTTGEVGHVRYGVLAAIEDDTRFRATLDGERVDLHQEGSEYGAVRVLYEDNPGGGYRGIGWMSTAARHIEQNAHTHGVDVHFLSPRGTWKIDGQVVYSDIEHRRNGAGAFVDVEYMPGGGVTHSVGVEYFDRHVDLNHLGFLRRNDVRQASYAWHVRQPGSGGVRTMERRVRVMAQTNADDQLTGNGIWLDWHLTTQALSRFSTSLSFYPERYDDRNSRGNGVYLLANRPNAELRWRSDTARRVSSEVAVAYRSEDLGGHTLGVDARLRLRPSERFSVELQLPYNRRDGWLLHQQGREFTTFVADEWRPSIESDWFLTARQQLRFTMQWVGIRAEEADFWLVPERPGSLLRRDQPVDRSDDFSISTLAMQLRYRWEIAPLSELFVVYTRGANLREPAADESFGRLFSDALRDPITDQLVVKLRYRFGS
jgi:hypothetical protein